MNRAKLMAVSVIILMMAFGLIIGCQNNPIAPLEQSADTQVAYKTVQFDDGVEPIDLTAEQFGLAKTIGLRSHYGRVYKDYGGWLVGPGVVLRLPPDDDWEDRQILYFEVQVSDNPAELDMQRDDKADGKKGKRGKKGRRGHRGNDDIGLIITLFDRHGDQLHINFDYSAWSNPESLNPFYQEDQSDTEGGVANLYVQKRYLKYLLGDKRALRNHRRNKHRQAAPDPYWEHFDPESDELDMNTSVIEEQYFSYIKYELPGFSRWGWIF